MEPASCACRLTAASGWWRCKDEQGAWGLAEGGELNLTLRPLERVLLVSAAPCPVLLANPSWLPAALGGPRLLPGQGGHLPFLGPGGFLQLAAPGFVGTTFTVSETGRNLGVRLVRIGRLAASLEDRRGQPVPGAAVLVREEPAQVFGGRRVRFPTLEQVAAVTEAKGSFVIPSVVPGQVRVRARAGAAWAPEEQVRLEPGGEVTMQLRLAAGTRLAFSLQDPEGRPVAGAQVRGSGPERGLSPRTTDGSGWVRFEKLQPGRYLLYVNAPGKANTCEAVQRNGERKTAKTITLAEGGVVEGLIRDLSANELEGVRVMVGASFTAPDASGRFRLEGVPLGSTEVEAWVFPGGTSREAPVEVSANAPAYVELDFSQGWALSGSLRQRGRGLAGYVIAAVSQGAGSLSNVTDEGGRSRLPGLGTGSYRVVASDTGGQVLTTA